MNVGEAISRVDWQAAELALKDSGFALISGLFSPEQCDELRSLYADADVVYRKTVEMSRYSYGMGEYKYFAYPLPEPVDQLRSLVYARLAPVANQWMQQLGRESRFPQSLEAFLAFCHEHDQTLATPLLLTYGEGGFNTLHQDIYGEVWFPLQGTVFLDQPRQDYSGGEFVISEQISGRASRLKVVNPQKGDLLIFATQFRPVPVADGFQPAIVEHGVCEISRGQRMTLGVIFHDASK
ncbi:Uncharacterised protein [BD1-7 clade bacterium]|uniref:Fe2OG dioxygenase domain-containing protein n=1 Tax=BD1-7 clade bacterium TaxID=2029982 RepID=A0A5S9PAF6_9GAMM|nr:Uncharacterised protein [BD1-7 clade bacterium]